MIKKFNSLLRKTKDNLVQYFTKIFEIIKEPEMGVLPGQIAFSMILSIVPILTIIGFGASFFGIDMDYIAIYDFATVESREKYGNGIRFRR